MNAQHSARLLLRFIVLAIAVLAPLRASAQDRLGGHFGAVLPLVTRAGGTTTTLGDDFSIGFPMGITVKTSDDWAFDLELVPAIQNDPLFVGLTVHPGIIRSLPDRYGAGVRMAFDVNQPSWGFTPLINRSFPAGRHAYFIEGVLPIRFQSDRPGSTRTSIGLGVHVGVGF
jgi:hypothetical protein